MELRYLISKIEGSNINFYKFFIGILSLTLLRNFIELFFDADEYNLNILGLGTYLHQSLFFIMSLITIIILVKILTKYDLIKIIKITGFFYFLILFAPIFDFILTLGKGSDIAYSMYLKNKR